MDLSQKHNIELQELMDERDREISGLKLELRGVKTQLDKCDVEVVELNNTIEELRRTSKSPNKDSSIYRSSKGFEEVRLMIKFLLILLILN